MKTAPVTTDIFRQVPIADISPSKTNPRKFVDQAQLEELAQSIKASGVQVPLLLRSHVEGFEIVGGERRWRAAQIAGLTSVPAIVREMSDAECREAQLIDNLQRSDLTPLEEAEAYQQMFAMAGDAGKPMTPADLAARVGKSESYIRLRMRLLTTPMSVRDALRSSAIALGHALELARLGIETQQALLNWLLYEESWNGKKSRREEIPSLAALRKHIAEEVMLDLSKAPFDTKSETLLSQAGSCLACPKRTGNSALLFADVTKGDTCTDPGCFKGKVLRHVDTVLELKGKGKSVIRVTNEWSREANTPKDVRTRSEITDIANSGHVAACDSTELAIWVDGDKAGKVFKVCQDKKCTKHHYIYNSAGNKASAAAERAKQRKETAVRARIFAAIHAATAELEMDDADILTLAEYAIHRADHNGLMKLASLAGWSKDLFARDKCHVLRAKLAEASQDEAIAFALMASVAGELTVSTWGSSHKPDGLEALAKSFGVDHAGIRKTVESEFAAKAKKKAAAKSSKKAAKKSSPKGAQATAKQPKPAVPKQAKKSAAKPKGGAS